MKNLYRVKACKRTGFAILLGCVFCLALGCRTISRYKESRQTIAARRLSRQGLEAMHAGQWDTAEGLFSGALDITQADDRAHWGLAESLWQRGEREAALKHMEQAVHLSASDPRLMRRLARMYLELNMLEQAEVQVAMAMEADRTSAEVWALQGDCRFRRNDQVGALASYHRALAIQPDYPEVQLQTAELYHQQGRYDRLLATIDCLQEGLESTEHCPARAQMLRGLALRELKRPYEAKQCFLAATLAQPDDSDLQMQLAETCLKLGDLATARTAVDRALTLTPNAASAIELARQLSAAESRVAEKDAAEPTTTR